MQRGFTSGLSRAANFHKVLIREASLLPDVHAAGIPLSWTELPTSCCLWGIGLPCDSATAATPTALMSGHEANEPVFYIRSIHSGRITSFQLRFGRFRTGGEKKPERRHRGLPIRLDRSWDGRKQFNGRKPWESGWPGKPLARRGVPSALPVTRQ